MRQRVGLGVRVAVRAAAMPVALGLRWAKHGQSGAQPGIPSPNWNLRLVSKVALDDLFFISELASATLVSFGNRKRLAGEISESVDFFGARGWLDDPEAYHQDPPELTRLTRDAKRWPLGTYDHVQFESGFEPHPGEPGRDRWLGYEANRTAHAWLFEHPGEPRPWLVCVPGYRMGQPLVDFTGFKARWIHQTLGLNVAIPVLPLHGPRRFGRRGGDGFLSGDFVDTVHAQAQAVWDIRRLMRWLRSNGAPAVGVHGVSLGGYTSALLSSLEDGIDCVIVGIPATDFVQLLKDHLPKTALSLAERIEFPFDRLQQLLSVVSPLAMPTRVPHDRRFLYAGTVDSVAAPSQARELWRHWNRPRLEWFQGGHVSYLWDPTVKSLLRDALRAGRLVDAE